MTPQTAHMALQFLQRVQLSGAEVPAYNRVLAEMTADAQGHTHGEPQSAPETADSAGVAQTPTGVLRGAQRPNGKGTRQAETKEA